MVIRLGPAHVRPLYRQVFDSGHMNQSQRETVSFDVDMGNINLLKMLTRATLNKKEPLMSIAEAQHWPDQTESERSL
jgi:hypothetical protein